MKNNLTAWPKGRVGFWDVVGARPSEDQRIGLVNYLSTWDKPEVEWVENKPFHARLTFAGWERGRSRVTLWFRDEEGTLFPFFLGDIERLLSGLVVEGDFQAVKRGDSYGLKFVEES